MLSKAPVLSLPKESICFSPSVIPDIFNRESSVFPFGLSLFPSSPILDYKRQGQALTRTSPKVCIAPFPVI